MRPLRHAIFAILAACLSAAAAHAGSGAVATSHAAPSALAARPFIPHRVITWKPMAWRPLASPVSSAQGLRVAIDPITGALTMPVDDGLASQVRVDGERPPLQSVLHADGTVQVILDDRYMEFAVASIGPAGLPVWNCVEGPSGARKFLQNPPSVSLTPVATPLKWEDQ